MNKNKLFFINELKSLEQEGINKLIEWLEIEGFFISPASTRFHGNYEGGLLDHSINVYKEFMKFPLKLPRRTKVITCLLHDICKTNTYIKTLTGYKFNKEIKGHALLSIQIIEKFLVLTKQEIEMIKYHMGWYGTIFWLNPEYKMVDLLKAMNNKEVKALHLADELATQFIDIKK